MWKYIRNLPIYELVHIKLFQQAIKNDNLVNSRLLQEKTKTTKFFVKVKKNNLFSPSFMQSFIDNVLSFLSNINANINVNPSSH